MGEVKAWPTMAKVVQFVHGNNLEASVVAPQGQGTASSRVRQQAESNAIFIEVIDSKDAKIRFFH